MASGGFGVALERLGLDQEALRTLGKGASEKWVMAWWLRAYTTLSRPWIAPRLQIGPETRVTLAVREVSRTKGGPLAKRKRRHPKVR